MSRDYGFIIPREIDDYFRQAMIPEFPSLFKNNPGDLFQDSYSCNNFTVHVVLPNDTETLGEADLSIEDLKLIDSRFQHAIGNWLMDKKARPPGNDEIEGNFDKLAKDIYGGHKVRSEDKKILLVNLKSLSALNYDVYIKEANKEENLSFNLIQNLEYDEDKRNFVAFLGENIIGENLLPHVVNDGDEGPESAYTTKSPQDLYPRQDRFEFNMRQYLATIKNNKQTIVKTGGKYLLNQFGYLSHCKEFKQKYRNEIAEIMIEATYRRIAREYGVIIERNNLNASPENVRDRFYSTHFPRNTRNANVPKKTMDVLVMELAGYIEDTGRKSYNNKAMYISRAKELIADYGFQVVKDAFEQERTNLTFDDLRGLLEASKASDDTL